MEQERDELREEVHDLRLHCNAQEKSIELMRRGEDVARSAQHELLRRGDSVLTRGMDTIEFVATDDEANVDHDVAVAQWRVAEFESKLRTTQQDLVAARD